jgi:hypothetical protein
MFSAAGNYTLRENVGCDGRTLVLWFSSGFPVSSINKTDRHDITIIVLNVALNNINHINHQVVSDAQGP